jgi:hypothetical protein
MTNNHTSETIDRCISYTVICVVLVCMTGFNFTALGLHPGMGITHRLPQLVGPHIAAQLLTSVCTINCIHPVIC